jgi:hypothetical protein
MNDEVAPGVLNTLEERRELFRIAAQGLIDHHEAGRTVDPHALKWAKHMVTYIKPLGRPLGTGDPA